MWEIYMGERGWDAGMKPETWAPVLTASDRYYDAWHNGDPSVVLRNGKYYMAYSATSKPYFKKKPGPSGRHVIVHYGCCVQGRYTLDQDRASLDDRGGGGAAGSICLGA